MGLNDVYTVMRCSILMMNPLPSMTHVFLHSSSRGKTKRGQAIHSYEFGFNLFQCFHISCRCFWK
uniref:Putative ovule protein n=1 Tax=Solanum chacoense TaxID=4108 RepID=A0A0V0GQ30_SOLCH